MSGNSLIIFEYLEYRQSNKIKKVEWSPTWPRLQGHITYSQPHTLRVVSIYINIYTYRFSFTVHPVVSGGEGSTCPHAELHASSSTIRANQRNASFRAAFFSHSHTPALRDKSSYPSTPLLSPDMGQTVLPAGESVAYRDQPSVAVSLATDQGAVRQVQHF